MRDALQPLGYYEAQFSVARDGARLVIEVEPGPRVKFAAPEITVDEPAASLPPIRALLRSGALAAGTPLAVDDQNPCTADACDPVTGVTHVALADGTPCADADLCNGAETCQTGTCAPGTPPPVDDGNACTADACDPATGVTHLALADGSPCPDADLCNGAETCLAGACAAGTPPVVDDGNVCTADACDPATGVTHVAVADGSPCPDANLCNGAETCLAGACAAGTPVSI